MLGFCQAILEHLSRITLCATPSRKITPAGFLRMLIANKPSYQIVNADSALKLSNGNGHIRDLKVKYRRRALPQETGTVDDCSIQAKPAYREMDIAITNYRHYAFFIAEDDLFRYCEEATEMVRLNGAPTPFMMEIFSLIMESANAMIGAVDQDLLTIQATRFGTNVVTGTNASTTVNFPGANAGVDLEFDEGMIKILQDAALNEMCGNLNIVGHGNFNAFTISQMVACCNQLGIDSSRFTGFNWYPDIYSQETWGANQIGVFDPNSVGFVEIDRYVGRRAGRRMGGASEFFNAPLPIDCPECNGNYDGLSFDFQVRYLDCPQVIDVDCGGEQEVGRGYIVDISKAFSLFNIPADAYQNEEDPYDCYTDRLFGNNGTLRYTVTNA